MDIFHLKYINLSEEKREITILTSSSRDGKSFLSSKLSEKRTRTLVKPFMKAIFSS